MATVHDVAAHILSKQSPMTTWKLQKLVYYSQAWHLTWLGRPLFESKIEAWANGPVVRDLYDGHSGRYEVAEWNGNPDALDADSVRVVDEILTSYGDLDGRKLSLLTHAERPWAEARGDLSPGARSNTEITWDSMAEYYGALDASPDAPTVEEIDWAE